MNFSGVITNDRNDVYAKVQGQRPNVKVTEVKTQISCFGTITPVLFHIWWWNDAQSYLQFEFTDGYEMMHKDWSSIEEVPYCF